MLDQVIDRLEDLKIDDGRNGYWERIEIKQITSSAAAEEKNYVKMIYRYTNPCWKIRNIRLSVRVEDEIMCFSDWKEFIRYP